MTDWISRHSQQGAFYQHLHATSTPHFRGDGFQRVMQDTSARKEEEEESTCMYTRMQVHMQWRAQWNRNTFNASAAVVT